MSITIPASPTLEQALDQALQTGIAHHLAGRLEFAEPLYRSILQAQPQHAEANHKLGLLCRQLGQTELSLEYLSNACASAPENGEYWISIADCLLALNRPQEAADILETAIQAGLDNPQASTLLAQATHRLAANPADPTPALDTESTLLGELGRLAKADRPPHKPRHKNKQASSVPPALQHALDAGDWAGLETAARHMLAQDPWHGKAWGLLGMAYLQLARNTPALLAISRASELLPGSSAVWDHLGIALRQAARHDDADRAFRQSLVLEPLRAETWVNLGNLQLDLRQTSKAIDSFRRALELKPDFFIAHNGLGGALRDAGLPEEATRSLQHALQLAPAVAEVHSNLGNAQLDLGQIDAAIASYQQAIALKPGLAEAHSGLGKALIDRGQMLAAIASYQRALAIKPDFPEAHSNLLQTLYAIDDLPPVDCLAEARRFGQRATQRASAPYRSWKANWPGTALRVGLVSGDLRNHPVGYFLENLLGHMDPTQVELIAYTTTQKEDELSARLRPRFSAWTSLQGMSDESAARRIHDDGVHILIDLAGHTSNHNRLPLFAWKPAPVQASWLGYFATTGLAEIDYLLGDPYVTPIEEEADFTETVWRLPECYLCFTPPNVPLEIAPLPARQEKRITFGCFNNLNKMNDEVVAVWAEVLHAVPGSRLYLKTKQLGDSAVCEITRQRFAARNIAADRLLLEGAAPRAQLLAAYQQVDIALDPFPYPGGTTSVEALWMGVPVLTRRGKRFLSHIGESIAHNARLGDWIAADNKDYVARAASHAGNLPQLAELRASLRRQVLTSPLFDGQRFAQQFTAALQGMWQARMTRPGQGNTGHEDFS